MIFKKLQKPHYEILTHLSQNFQDAREIAAVQSTYINDISVIIPFIKASFYETSTWVKWKVEVKNTDNNTSSAMEEDKPCRIPLQKLLLPFLHQTKTEILNHKNSRNISIIQQNRIYKNINYK